MRYTSFASATTRFPSSYRLPHMLETALQSSAARRHSGMGSVTFQGRTSCVITVGQTVLIMLQQHCTTNTLLLVTLYHLHSEGTQCRPPYMRVVQYILVLHKPTAFLSLALIVLNNSQGGTSVALPIPSQLLPHVTFLTIFHH